MQETGISSFSIKNVLPHKTETFRRGTLLFFRKILVSEKCNDMRFQGRGITIFF